jgi:hypothetical protein
MNAFDTPLTIQGPYRQPTQLLAEQSMNGRASIHDDAAAAALGLTGAPIEGPTHFSQLDPLAYGAWGPVWFERGCVSSHFQTMVVEGDEVQASLITAGPSDADIEAHTLDGTPVLTGTASIGQTSRPTALATRLEAQRPPTSLSILDQLSVGMTSTERVTSVITFDVSNGPRYPFTLREKLEAITEPSPWYRTTETPWGRPILPFEMISVLAHKDGPGFPVRQPSVGLFLDLEVRLHDGPLFVDEPYDIAHTIVGMSESRRTESFWTQTSITAAGGGPTLATVLLHQGVFKDSYPDYPHRPDDARVRQARAVRMGR